MGGGAGECTISRHNVCAKKNENITLQLTQYLCLMVDFP